MEHPVFYGSAVFLAFEAPTEIMDALESHQLCDIADGGIGIDQKLPGFLHADGIHVSNRRGMIELLEHIGKGGFAGMCRQSHIIQTDDMGIMELDIFHQGSYIDTPVCFYGYLLCCPGLQCRRVVRGFPD